MNDTNPRRLTIARAMAEAVQQEMQQDPKVFVMGDLVVSAYVTPRSQKPPLLALVSVPHKTVCGRSWS
jgi:hypothetical protein